MWSDLLALKSLSEMTRVEIASTVEQIVAAVAHEHGLMEARDRFTRVMLDSRLDDDLGMDEVDLIAVLFRAEERFGLVLPDDIGPSSTVNDIVDLIAEPLREKEAHLARAQANESWKDLPEHEASESTLVGPEQGFVREVPELQ